jgi:seryl-tRNA synthetase
MSERDFLDKLIDKRAARNPEFPRLLDAARRRRELLRALAGQREEQKRSQTAIAAAMETSQSFVARLESTAADAKISGRFKAREMPEGRSREIWCGEEEEEVRA